MTWKTKIPNLALKLQTRSSPLIDGAMSKFELSIHGIINILQSNQKIKTNEQAFLSY